MEEIAKALPFRYNENAIQRVIYSESHDEVANGKARIPQEIEPERHRRATMRANVPPSPPAWC